MLVSNRTSLSVKAKEGIQAPIAPVDWDGIMSRQAFLAFAPFRPEVGDYGYVAITRAVLCFSASLDRHTKVWRGIRIVEALQGGVDGKFEKVTVE
jgi:hypothetical protein